MGTTEDCFQLAGGRPHTMEWLNSFVSEGVIAVAVDLSIRAEMPSGPLALDTSRHLSSSYTSSSEHRIWEHSGSLVEVTVEIGGYAELKQLEKNSLNAFALSSSELQVVLSCVKVPIVVPCLFKILMVFQNFLVSEVFKLEKKFFLACLSLEVTLLRARLY